MTADELNSESFDKLTDKEKVEYLKGELGNTARLLIEGHYIVSEYSSRYEDLWLGVKGLLDFVKGKFPDDFKEGGKGFTCEHHKRLEAHLKKYAKETV